MSSINDLTVEQLKAELKRKGCRGYSKNNKAELVKLLRKCNTAKRIHKTLEKSRTTHVKKKSSPPAKKKSSHGKNPSAAGAAGKNPSARALSAGAGDYGSTYPRDGAAGDMPAGAGDYGDGAGDYGDGAAGKKPIAGDIPAATAGDVFDNSYLMTEISNYLPVNELGNTLQTHKQMRQNISNIDKRRRLKALMGDWKRTLLPPEPPRLRRQRRRNIYDIIDNPGYQTLIRCRRCYADIEGEISIDNIAERLQYNQINNLETVPVFLCYNCEREIAYKTKYKIKRKNSDWL